MLPGEASGCSRPCSAALPPPAPGSCAGGWSRLHSRRHRGTAKRRDEWCCHSLKPSHHWHQLNQYRAFEPGYGVKPSSTGRTLLHIHGSVQARLTPLAASRGGAPPVDASADISTPTGFWLLPLPLPIPSGDGCCTAPVPASHGENAQCTEDFYFIGKNVFLPPPKSMHDSRTHGARGGINHNTWMWWWSRALILQDVALVSPQKTAQPLCSDSPSLSADPLSSFPFFFFV